MDSDWHVVYNSSNGESVNNDRAILMGNHIWIGCNSVILKGAEIPENCVIAAGSVVSGRLPKPDSVYVRNNPIKNGINWKY
jgi:acetyltransferase-like isoleucine patch superfamily enzyme